MPYPTGGSSGGPTNDKPFCGFATTVASYSPLPPTSTSSIMDVQVDSTCGGCCGRNPHDGCTGNVKPTYLTTIQTSDPGIPGHWEIYFTVSGGATDHDNQIRPHSKAHQKPAPLDVQGNYQLSFDDHFGNPLQQFDAPFNATTPMSVTYPLTPTGDSYKVYLTFPSMTRGCNGAGDKYEAKTVFDTKLRIGVQYVSP
jgi:hypothetical protein